MRRCAAPLRMVKNLTHGSPLKCILGFAAPMFLGMLFQQVYNMVDTMIVGRFLGLEPLAGVGSTGSLYFLVIGSCTGICSGFAIPVAQSFGAQDDSSVRRFVTNSVWLSAALSVVLTTLTVCLCRNMLTLMNTPEEAFEYAYMYIVIIFAGIPTTFLYNVSSAIIRALGDSRTPLIFLIISSLLNIALDLVFILLCNMNVAGAALATVISQLVSGAGCTIYMMRKFDILKMQPGDWKVRGREVKGLCAIGLPMGLQYSITAIGSVSVQSAVNSFGSIAVAGVTAANKIYSIISCPQEALGATMATHARSEHRRGQDRARQQGAYTSVSGGHRRIDTYLYSGAAVQSADADAVPRRGRDRSAGICAPVYDRDYRGLPSAYAGMRGAIHHTGHGIFHVRDDRGCAGDDRALLRGVRAVDMVRLPGRVLLQHMRVDCGGLVPCARVHTLPQGGCTVSAVRRAAQVV